MFSSVRQQKCSKHAEILLCFMTFSIDEKTVSGLTAALIAWWRKVLIYRVLTITIFFPWDQETFDKTMQIVKVS